MIRLALAAALALFAGRGAQAREAAGLDAALGQLSQAGRFSGAVVVRDAEGVRFARGYGPADPFTEGRAFMPDTPVDSASLAKPVTAAVVLILAKDGRIDLDAPVRRYLPGYPHAATTVRHLLAHAAGLPPEEALEPLAGKTNEMLMDEVRTRGLPPQFRPGSGFAYCNVCYSTLGLLAERVSGRPFLALARERAGLPSGVTIRPRRLRDWRGRAIGYRAAVGKVERADSYEDEAFYGAANLSISASQLAAWGARWWTPRLAPIRSPATTPARIEGAASGLTWGNWYCAPQGLRCHYLGHHEGFHHMLYWDAERRLSVAMVSNNTLAPGLQQRLQRALVAFAEGREDAGHRELKVDLPDQRVRPGAYRLSSGERVVVTGDDRRLMVQRRGVSYRAYRVGSGIRYVPGLDTYLAGATDGRLNWLSLYEDLTGDPTDA